MGKLTTFDVCIVLHNVGNIWNVVGYCCEAQVRISEVSGQAPHHEMNGFDCLTAQLFPLFLELHNNERSHDELCVCSVGSES